MGTGKKPKNSPTCHNCNSYLKGADFFSAWSAFGLICGQILRNR